MAAHKVPQDVEADDKFLGPFSFKQFLFLGGFAISGYLSFLTLTKVWPVSFIFIVPMIAFGVLAFPWSKEQPTELFLASRIRFLIKPRKRIWDQSGVKELVNITVPVTVAHVYSDGLSQGEVHNRLNALATIVDSRGWAVKNVSTNDESSDRLVQPAKTEPTMDTGYSDSTPDVLDETSGTIARQFDNMIEQSEKQHKSETMHLIEDARRKTANTTPSDIADKIHQQKPLVKTNSGKTADADKKSEDFWFLNSNPEAPTNSNLATFQSSTVVAPGASSSTTTPAQTQHQDDTSQLSEEDLLERVHKKQERDALQNGTRHEKVIDPNGPQKPVQPQPKNIADKNKTISTMTPPTNPDILNLAQSNDLSVETLSRQANKKTDFGDDEVVISLH